MEKKKGYKKVLVFTIQCGFCYLIVVISFPSFNFFFYLRSNIYVSSYSGVRYSKLIANSNMYFLLHLLNCCRESKWIWSWQTIACLGWVAMIYSNESRSNTQHSYSPTYSRNSLCLFLAWIACSHRLKKMPNIPFSFNQELK